MMKRAYHRIIWNDGSVTEGPVVVEFDNENNVVSYHLMSSEEAETEWIGGEYVAESRK